MTTLPIIRTERLVLRAPRPQDLDRCAELLGDYEVARMLSRVPHPYDLDRGRVFLDRSAAAWLTWPSCDELPFHVDLDGKMIGGVGFRTLRQTPEIGYWLGRPYWGKGFMSEAVQAAVEWLFQNSSHKLLASEVMADNPVSLKVLQKIGFTEVSQVGCQSISRGASVSAIRTELMRENYMTGR